MSKSKSIELHAAQFKALSNPNRLSLFKRLMSCCIPGTVCTTDKAIRYCVGELAKGLDIAPSTVSHHLKALNQAGLIHMERQGKTIHCWVEPEILKQLAHFFTCQED